MLSMTDYAQKYAVIIDRSLAMVHILFFATVLLGEAILHICLYVLVHPYIALIKLDVKSVT